MVILSPHCVLCQLSAVGFQLPLASQHEMAGTHLFPLGQIGFAVAMAGRVIDQQLLFPLGNGIRLGNGRQQSLGIGMQRMPEQLLAFRQLHQLSLADHRNTVADKAHHGRAILRILPTSGGDILYKGQKINGKISRQLDKQIIKEIQMIFQDPQSSLNERAKVSYIVGEGLQNVRPDLTAAQRKSWAMNR